MARPGERMRLKDRIVDNISKAIKSIQELVYYQYKDPVVTGHEGGVVLYNNNRLCHKLCENLDHALLHGLKHVIRGYWCVIKQLSPHATVKEIEMLINVTTDLGKGRAWLYTSLNEGLLESYIRLLCDNHKLLRKYYAKEALVLDRDRMSVLLTLTSGLDCVKFKLDCDMPYLDLNAYPPRSRSNSNQEGDVSSDSSDSYLGHPSHYRSMSELCFNLPTPCLSESSHSDSASLTSLDAQTHLEVLQMKVSTISADSGFHADSYFTNGMRQQSLTSVEINMNQRMQNVTPSDSVSLSSVSSSGDPDRHQRLESVVISGCDSNEVALEVVHLKNKKDRGSKSRNRKMERNHLDACGKASSTTAKPACSHGNQQSEDDESNKTHVFIKKVDSKSHSSKSVISHLVDSDVCDGNSSPTMIDPHIAGKTVTHCDANVNGYTMNKSAAVLSASAIADSADCPGHISEFCIQDTNSSCLISGSLSHDSWQTKLGDVAQGQRTSSPGTNSETFENDLCSKGSNNVPHPKAEDDLHSECTDGTLENVSITSVICESDLLRHPKDIAESVGSELSRAECHKSDFCNQNSSDGDSTGHKNHGEKVGHISETMIGQKMDVPETLATFCRVVDLADVDCDSKLDACEQFHTLPESSESCGQFHTLPESSESCGQFHTLPESCGQFHTLPESPKACGKFHSLPEPSVACEQFPTLPESSESLAETSTAPVVLSKDIKEIHQAADLPSVAKVNQESQSEDVDLSISLDNNTVLQLMLDVFSHEDEKFLKMFVTWENHTEGGTGVAYVLISDQCLYILHYHQPSRKFLRQSFTMLTDIIFISTGMNGQTLNIESRGKNKQKQRMWLAPGNQSLSQAIVACLSDAVRAANEHAPTRSRFSIGSEVPLQKIALRKYVSRELNCKPEDVKLCDYSLLFWEELTQENILDNIVAKEGILHLRAHDPKKGFIWKPVYVILKKSMLHIKNNKQEPRPEASLSLGGDQCVGCRLTSLPGHSHCVELILAKTGSWTLSADSQAEISEWRHSLCLAVSQGTMENETFMTCIPCCAVVACNNLFLCHEDLYTKFYRTLDMVRLEDITSIEVDDMETVYCIITLASKSSKHWALYFNSAQDLDRHKKAVCSAWRDIHKKELPVMPVADMALQSYCRSYSDRLKQQLVLR